MKLEGEIKEEIKQIQDVIKQGCAGGRPYPWCDETVDCEPRACWYHEAKEIAFIFIFRKYHLAKCKCGHLFEEHDWGAYVDRQDSCLVEGCNCEYFEAKGGKQ